MTDRLQTKDLTTGRAGLDKLRERHLHGDLNKNSVLKQLIQKLKLKRAKTAECHPFLQNIFRWDTGSLPSPFFVFAPDIPIKWSSQVYKGHRVYTAENNKTVFRCQIAGYYWVHAMMNITWDADITDVHLINFKLWKNNSEAVLLDRWLNPSEVDWNEMIVQGSVIMQVKEGDELFVTIDVPGKAVAGANPLNINSRFEAFWLGNNCRTKSITTGEGIA